MDEPADRTDAPPPELPRLDDRLRALEPLTSRTPGPAWTPPLRRMMSRQADASATAGPAPGGGGPDAPAQLAAILEAIERLEQLPPTDLTKVLEAIDDLRAGQDTLRRSVDSLLAHAVSTAGTIDRLERNVRLASLGSAVTGTAPPAWAHAVEQRVVAALDEVHRRGDEAEAKAAQLATTVAAAAAEASATRLDLSMALRDVRSEIHALESAAGDQASYGPGGVERPPVGSLRSRLEAVERGLAEVARRLGEPP